MPTYPYKCSCDHEFDIIARMAEVNKLVVACPNCAKLLDRDYKQFIAVNFTNTKVEDIEMCPALGCLVKNQKHREEIAKSRGLEPIGNESIDTVNQFFDQKKADIEKKQASELKHEILGSLQ